MKRTDKLKSHALPYCILLIAGVFLLSALFHPFYKDPPSDALASSAEPLLPPTVILDAGHGGMDSGAVSVRGYEEKHLNLAVTEKLGAFLEAAGIRVIYTRREDVMLECEEGGTKKSADLIARAKIAAANPDAPFISIHMNTLPIEKYDGLQVFYAEKCPAGRALAQVLQNNVIAMLQPNNHREAKDAEGKIFLLERVKQTAVLIECGFLSNNAEAAMLENELYQNKLCYVLSRTIVDFMAEQEKN